MSARQLKLFRQPPPPKDEMAPRREMTNGEFMRRIERAGLELTAGGAGLRDKLTGDRFVGVVAAHGGLARRATLVKVWAERRARSK